MILGIYSLLCALALGGLLLSLTKELERDARRLAEVDATQLLDSIYDSLQGHDPADIHQPILRKVLASRGRSLLIVDSEGRATNGQSEPIEVNEVGLTSVRLSELLKVAANGEIHFRWGIAESDTLFCIQHIADSDDFLLLTYPVADRIEEASKIRRATASVAVIAGLWGAVCLAFVSASIVGPMRLLKQAVQPDETPSVRQDLLFRLADRNDEFAYVAKSLIDSDKEKSGRLREVEKQERKTRSSATQLAAILQAMAEGVIAVDDHERILFANSRACLMLEHRGKNLDGRMLFEVARNTHLQDAVRTALADRSPTSVELKLTRNETQVTLLVSPISSGGAVLVLADVTEVRKLESMRRDFVNGVSHELKTPLTVIQACTETLLDGALEDHDASRRFLRQIEEQSERLLQLILGMLQLARLESGEQVFEEEPVDLYAVANQVITAMMPVAEGKRITLTLIGEKELFVLADFQAIRTVAGNLIDNALKYTPEGGAVTVELLTEEDANALRVIDTGVGIATKDQKRIFERFYRVERDRNRERGGTGLGLSIVKHLCQAMHADVSLQSAEGKGATIEVRFPFRD